MNDLISRAAAIITVLRSDYNLRYVDQRNGLSKQLEQLPAVDAAPVVRCRDCKFYYGVNEECGCNGGYHSEDWYCADGERRDEDATD